MFSELVNKSQNHEESIKFSTYMKKVTEINEVLERIKGESEACGTVFIG